MSNCSNHSAYSLLPFLLFVGLFLGAGIYYSWQGIDYAFYQLPASVAIIPAIMLAMLIYKRPLDEKVAIFIQGAGNENIITMCLIYLLAGAFSVIAKATGSVDASVGLGLAFFSEQMILPGLFIVSAIVATAMGTSMGTIAAIAPIALGVAEQTELAKPLVAGVVLSGAIFGDNLSVISDTTIAATKTQGADIGKKFRTNLIIALPAALVCLLILVTIPTHAVQSVVTPGSALAVLPYATILLLALMRVNVFVVLLTGIALAAILGVLQGDYQLPSVSQDINSGFASMQDILILSLLIGGLSQLVKVQGGIAVLTAAIQHVFNHWLRLSQQRAALAGVAALAFISNFFTANNTISIIISGEVAKSLTAGKHIAREETASYLDIFACINQGLLPYGAQALLLGATLSISPLELIQYSIYPLLLAVFALGRLVVRKQTQAENVSDSMVVT